MVKSKGEVKKMRVIAGDKKGFPIKNIKGTNTRPTSGKVKGAIFNMIAPLMSSEVKALDCFAGSGGLGIEFLSRGGSFCKFVELNYLSYKCLKENLDKLGFESKKFNLIKGDVYKVIKNEEKYDCIFIDPPYNRGLAQKMMDDVKEKDLLNNDGIVVIEHSKNEEVCASIAYFTLFKQKLYGDTTISVYKKNGLLKRGCNND
ncbi:16S rRNA (guanine(966)-N(2))-methyltransferase RsmD [Proteinivorax hydrogeniformans]|uniref:16S rRNA (Guanine(966)-N(2))-methyltransferase RsmD n=1 Tax=Proteinivorax hydrogeniformans TaxID=1826727 RepID=A0AAU8HPC5_9FIRM